MITIHKYLIPSYAGDFSIYVRGFIRWLDVGEQYGQLVAWAEVDDSEPDELRSVSVRWTGQYLSPVGDKRFLRSVQIDDYVHHIYVD